MSGRRTWSTYQTVLGATVAVVLGLLVGATVQSVYAAGVTVNSPVAMDKQHTMAIGDLIPSGCAPIAGSIVSVVNGATNTALWGSNNANNSTLYLWNSENQTTGGGGGNMNGGNGADCLVPGGVRSGANLTVGGGKGADYCYTGPGPGSYTANSCNNSPLFATPYLTSAVSNPAFS